MFRNRDIHPGLLQPADMLWSVDQLIDKMEDQIDLTRERMDAELKKRSDVLQSEIDNLNEQFASIWTDEGSKK